MVGVLHGGVISQDVPEMIAVNPIAKGVNYEIEERVERLISWIFLTCHCILHSSGCCHRSSLKGQARGPRLPPRPPPVAVLVRCRRGGTQCHRSHYNRSVYGIPLNQRRWC